MKSIPSGPSASPTRENSFPRASPAYRTQNFPADRLTAFAGPMPSGYEIPWAAENSRGIRKNGFWGSPERYGIAVAKTNVCPPLPDILALDFFFTNNNRFEVRLASIDIGTLFRYLQARAATTNTAIKKFGSRDVIWSPISDSYFYRRTDVSG